MIWLKLQKQFNQAASDFLFYCLINVNKTDGYIKT